MQFRLLSMFFLAVSLILSSCGGMIPNRNESTSMQAPKEVDPLPGEWWKKPPELHEIKNPPQPLTEIEKN